MRCAYPDSSLRFFRKDKFVDWPTRIHSTPILNGDIGHIPPKEKNLAYIHLCNETISETIAKTNVYTDKEMQRRKNKNYGLVSLMFEPFVRFFRSYIIKGGICDGKAGLIWAFENAFYKFAVVAKCIEAKVNHEDWDSEIKP